MLDGQVSGAESVAGLEGGSLAAWGSGAGMISVCSMQTEVVKIYYLGTKAPYVQWR